MIYAFKKRKSFSEIYKYFWSNRNHFPVNYYFRPYQTPENAEIIFQNFPEIILRRNKWSINLK